MNFRPPWKHQEGQNSNWMNQGSFRNNKFQPRRQGMGMNDSRDHDRRNNSPWAGGGHMNNFPKPPDTNRIPSLLDLPPATAIWEQPPPNYDGNQLNRPYNAPGVQMGPSMGPSPVPPPVRTAPMPARATPPPARATPPPARATPPPALAPPPQMPLSLLLQNEIRDSNKNRGDTKPNPSGSAVKPPTAVQQVDARQEMGRQEVRKVNDIAADKKPGTDDLLVSLNKYHEEFQLSKYANPPNPDDVLTENATATAAVPAPNASPNVPSQTATPNAASQAPRENRNSESVTQKLLNRLTLMDKHNIKQVINDPEPKYESALKKRANQLIRANVRQKLQHFSIEEPGEGEGEQRGIEPDMVLDSDKVPEVVFNEIKNVLGLEAQEESFDNSIEQDSMFMEFDSAIEAATIEANIQLDTFSGGAVNTENIQVIQLSVPTEDFSLEQQAIKENVTLQRISRESTEILGDANTSDSVMNEAVDTNALSPLMVHNEEDRDIPAFADNGIPSANEEFVDERKSQSNLIVVPLTNINEQQMSREEQQNYRMPPNRPNDRFPPRNDERNFPAGRRNYDSDRSRGNFTRDARDTREWDNNRPRDDGRNRDRDRGIRTPERNQRRSPERDRRPMDVDKRDSEDWPVDQERRLRSPDRRGPEMDRRGQEADRRGPETERWGAEADRRGQETDRRGPEIDRRGTEIDRRGPEADRRGPETERWGPETDRRPMETDRRPMSSDRGSSERRQPEQDRIPQSSERRPPDADRRTPERDRRPPESDRRPDRRPSVSDRRQNDQDRRPSEFDRRNQRGRPPFQKRTPGDFRKRSNEDQGESSMSKKKRFDRKDGPGQRVWLSPGEKKCLPQSESNNDNTLFGPMYKSKYVQTMYQPPSPTKSVAERELKIFHEMKQIDTSLMEMQRKKIEIDQHIQKLQTELMSIEMQSMKLQNKRFDLLNRILTIPVANEECLMESDFEMSPMKTDFRLDSSSSTSSEPPKKVVTPNPEALKSFKIPKRVNTTSQGSQAHHSGMSGDKKKQQPPPKSRKPTTSVSNVTNQVKDIPKVDPPKVVEPPKVEVVKSEPSKVDHSKVDPPKSQAAKSEVSKSHPPGPKKERKESKEKKDTRESKESKDSKDMKESKDKKSSKTVKFKASEPIKKQSPAPVAKPQEEPRKVATPEPTPPTDWSKILKDCSVNVEKYSQEMINKVLSKNKEVKEDVTKEEAATKSSVKGPKSGPKSQMKASNAAPQKATEKVSEKIPENVTEKLDPKEEILATEWEKSLENTTKTSVIRMEVVKGCVFVAVKDDMSLHRFSSMASETKFQSLKLHTKPISSFVCHENGHLYTISADGFVRKVSCDGFSGSLSEFDCGGVLNIIAKVPWGKLYIVKEDKKIIALDAEKLGDKKELNCETKILGVVGSEVDGQKVISVASQGSEFSIRNAETGELIKRFHLEWTIDFFTGHKNMLHCGIDAKDLIHYKIMTGEEIARCNIGQRIIHVKYVTDLIFILSSKGVIYVWNCVENQFIGVIKGPEGEISGFDVEDKKIYIITSQNFFWSCNLPKRLLSAPSCKSKSDSTDNSNKSA